MNTWNSGHLFLGPSGRRVLTNRKAFILCTFVKLQAETDTALENIDLNIFTLKKYDI